MPRLTHLEMQGGQKCAVFGLQVRGASGSAVVVRAIPDVYTDTRLDDLPEGVIGPRVVGWSGVKEVMGNTATVVIDGEPVEIQVTVAIMGDYAVHLTCDVASGVAP